MVQIVADHFMTEGFIYVKLDAEETESDLMGWIMKQKSNGHKYCAQFTKLVDVYQIPSTH